MAISELKKASDRRYRQRKKGILVLNTCKGCGVGFQPPKGSGKWEWCSFGCRLFAKVRKSDNPEGCWEWIGGKNDKGYGFIGIDGRNALAHRASWKLHNGPIPSGMVVYHHCDNPSCVNPDHLFVGTSKDNYHDCLRKGRIRIARGEQRRAKVTERQVREMRKLWKTGRYTLKELGERYGLNRYRVQVICSNKAWKHVG